MMVVFSTSISEAVVRIFVCTFVVAEKTDQLHGMYRTAEPAPRIEGLHIGSMVQMRGETLQTIAQALHNQEILLLTRNAPSERWLVLHPASMDETELAPRNISI